MERTVICVVLAVLGLCMGSFAGAQVWRLRARQLKGDKAAGEKVDKKEYKKLLPLAETSATSDRSRCLHCGHTLAWYDLLPLVSWAATRGKCRYCHEKIGWFEPVIEVSVALFFVGSFLLWPGPLVSVSQVAIFALWLVAGVLLAILFAYDLRWFLLPNRVVFPLIAVAAAVAALRVAGAPDAMGALVSVAVAVVLLSGIYLVLYLASKGRWIGFGDVKLGLALALLLGDWQLAFIALFAANLIGCIIVIPGMAAGKLTRGTHVPFGPLLIAGAVVAMWLGEPILNWYFSAFI